MLQAEDEANLVATEADFTAPRIAGLLLVSLIPFWLIPAAHVLSSPETATGFFHYELPYYVANGRAAFERGNGVLYPNPYDPAGDAPSIYAHWLPWILGALTAPLGFDPGDVILVLTVGASLAFAWVTRAIVNQRLPQRGPRNVAFLAAMWGGGILALAGTIAGLGNDSTWMESVLAFDPGSGLWFLNWGRNALFPTESIYHVLAVCCWLAEIKRRKIVANAFLFALATTHPWSGLELLLTINLWRGLELVRRCSSEQIQQLAISGGVLVGFLTYYKIWLPTFPQHAELQGVWELNWSLSWTSAALAYVPVAIPAAMVVRQRLQTRSFERAESFLLCALFIATGLAFHDRLIKPVQPIHFTRGYVWMPLFLLGLPVWAQWWTLIWQQRQRAVIAIPVLSLLIVADNAVFSVVHCQRQLAHEEGFYLNPAERAMCRELHQLASTSSRTVLTESSTLNYLIPSYANVRPWLGHQFNTPQFPERSEVWEACFHDNGVDPEHVPADVHLLVIRRERSPKGLIDDHRWAPVGLRNADWEAWQRIGDDKDIAGAFNAHQ